MVRETARPRREREEKELRETQMAEWAVFTATYPVKFANLMFKYAELDFAGFKISKLDEQTYTFLRCDYAYKQYTLTAIPPSEYDWEYVNEFELAHDLLADYDREQAEVFRRSEMRLNALNKLTKEERELLGI